jgi:hypothetical protein
MHKNLRFSIKSKYGILLLAVIGSILLAACTGTTEQPSMDALFSPTPTLTPTPTTQWFPVTATAMYVAVSTATPNPGANPEFGSLIFSDQTNTDKNWPASQTVNGSVLVNEGSVTLAISTPRRLLTVFRNNTSLIDYYFESTMNVSLCKKEDVMGVLFRAAGSQSYYRLLFNCQGMITLQQVIGGTPSPIKDWALSNQVQSGLNPAVKIGIWVSGKIIRIYLNDQLQFETTNNVFSDGGIGFYARSAGDTAVTVKFSSISVFAIN